MHPKVHMLALHVPTFDVSTGGPEVIVPKKQLTETQRTMSGMVGSTLKGVGNMWGNVMSKFAGKNSEMADKDIVHLTKISPKKLFPSPKLSPKTTLSPKKTLPPEKKNSPDEMTEELGKEVHKKLDKGKAKYQFATYWKPIEPTTEELKGGKTFGIDDEFPHRLIVSAYTLNKSFFNTFAGRGLQKWTWPEVHSMISRNILDREDLSAVLFRQKPKPEDLVYDYRESEKGMTVEFDESRAYKDLRERTFDESSVVK